MEHAAGFPGVMFNAEGVSLDATIPDLTEGKLKEYPHRSMVAQDGTAPVARVWLLSDDAEFAAVHSVIMAEAVKLVLSGKAIVILARRLEPAVDVRDGLLDALDLLSLPWDGGARMNNNDLVKAEAITPDQLKAARALLGWSQARLGLRSNTSAYVVKKFELTGQIASVYGRPDLTDPLATIRATLEAAGVEFTEGEALEVAASETTPITPGQVKFARKLLRWSRKQLGVRSGTSIHVVQTFERTGQVAKLYGQPRGQVNTVAAIRATLEAAGIEFSNRRVPGVRGRTPSVRLREQGE